MKTSFYRKSLPVMIGSLIFASAIESAPPTWSATGDSFVVNIVFPTLVEQMKKMPAKESRILNANLTRKSQNSIGMELETEIMEGDLKGAICNVKTDLVIDSMDIQKAVLKLRDMKVVSCSTNRGALMDSIVEAGAAVAIGMMSDKIEQDVNKSVNKTIYTTVNQLKEKAGKSIAMDYQVYPGGLSLFIFAGEKQSEAFFQNVPYTAAHPSDCSEVAAVRLFHSYDTTSKYSGNIELSVNNLKGKNAGDWFEVHVHGTGMEKTINSGYIMPGKNYVWSEPIAAHATKSITIEFSSGAALVKALSTRCGSMEFSVPENGDLKIEIDRKS